MWDAILVVLGSSHVIAKRRVETEQVLLRTEVNRSLAPGGFYSTLPLDHHGAAQPQSTRLGRHDDPSDDRLGAKLAGREDTHIGNQLSIEVAKEMPGSWIEPVEVEVGTVLLYNEHLLSQACEGVQRVAGHIVPGNPGPRGGVGHADHLSECTGLAARPLRYPDPRRWRLRTLGPVIAAAWLFTGCAILEDVADGVKAPKSSLNRVDLLHAPTALELVSWQCEPLLGANFCGSLGLPATPTADDLMYSFDLVFDVRNPNSKVPIPLVEVLIGMNVIDTANLGTACISFCDPDEEACEPAVNAEGACEVDESDQLKGPEDLIPTVDDLIDLADDAVSGELGENGAWRYIPGGSTVEAHIQFDLASDVMLQLADFLVEEALDDLIAGRNLKIDVPYATEGTVFFDVPELGRHAAGFGPWEDTWVLKE